MNGIHICERKVNGGEFVVLVANSEIENPNGLLTLAVSEVVARSMYNDFIDISLHRPYLRLVWIGDLNTLVWKRYNGYNDCEYIEFDLKNQQNDWEGRVVFMRGGLYQDNPNQYMSDRVYEYVNKLDRNKFSVFNEMVESTLDNQWFRAILLNIDHLTFIPSMQ